MSKVDKETMSLLVECEDCKHRFSISAGQAAYQVTHKKKYVVDGKEIFLTYYDCPKCGRRHFVQIDDANTLRQLREVSTQMGKLTAMKRKDKEIPKKITDKFKKARKHLANNRNKLMKIYTGVSVHDEATDSDFVLRFSV